MAECLPLKVYPFTLKIILRDRDFISLQNLPINATFMSVFIGISSSWQDSVLVRREKIKLFLNCRKNYFI